MDKKRPDYTILYYHAKTKPQGCPKRHCRLPAAYGLRLQQCVRHSLTPRQIRSYSKTASPHRAPECNRRAVTSDNNRRERLCTQSAHTGRAQKHSRRKSGAFQRHIVVVCRAGDRRTNPTLPSTWVVRYGDTGQIQSLDEEGKDADGGAVSGASAVGSAFKRVAEGTQKH